MDHSSQKLTYHPSIAQVCANGNEGSSETSIPRPKIISLFCGAGGLDLGFEQAGYEVALAVDFNKASVDTHNLNSKKKVAIQLDLSSVTGNDLKKKLHLQAGNVQPVGIIGGPPCQGFSQANTKRSHADPRNNLAKNYTKIIVQLSKIYPIDFFVFENVAGLLAEQNATVLQDLRDTLNEEFEVFSSLLNAQYYGVPQSRERFFMIGLRKNSKGDRAFVFPEPSTPTPLTVRETIESLPQATFFSRGLTPESIPYHPNHWTMRPISKRFGPDLINSGRSLIRLAWDKPSRTVCYGHREIHVHPSGTRRLTILEAMLLQGFPKSYKFAGTLSDQVTQVSNAVPPPLAFALANAVKMSSLRK